MSAQQFLDRAEVERIVRAHFPRSPVIAYGCGSRAEYAAGCEDTVSLILIQLDMDPNRITTSTNEDK